jgi:hypothetical protein
MTKMISKYDAERWVEHEETSDVMEVLISNDKFELIEMLIERVKTMEVGDSVMMNLVSNEDEEESDWMEKNKFLDTNCIVKSEVIYTLGEGL